VQVSEAPAIFLKKLSNIPERSKSAFIDTPSFEKLRFLLSQDFLDFSEIWQFRRRGLESLS
jgi:hypothetical protein